MQFETIVCPVCGSADYRHELEVRDRFETIVGHLYTIVRCTACRLLYLNPRPDAASVSAFYGAEEYDPFLSSGSRVSAFTRLYRFVRRFTVRRKAWRVSNGLPRGARCLDVGCATGEFVAELRRRGFDACGVEPSPMAAEHARSTYGLTVWTGTVTDVPDSAGPFDLITLWHVLEHLHDLRGNLERMRSLLKEGGRLAIAVPNPSSSDARAYGAKWVAWDTPRHLYHFEPTVMTDLLIRAGFHARRHGAVAFDAFYHSLLSESGGAIRLLRAGMRGGWSFFCGSFGGAGSSELYIAEKR
ncbi:class I SAM-dependent methyltransferase [bacterium]|nr:class I SAM-dependent methyltransferase [bacterium]MBU1982803.1 class I SAM-dependent methyltransferase [bacterium]